MPPDQRAKTSRADASATEWDDALLFEVAVDPFQQIATSGREEGRAAGLRNGYLEGVNIGRSKGWEIGLELGYIHDLCEGILDGYQQAPGRQTPVTPQCDGNKPQKPPVHRTSHRLERCLALARDLVKIINEFPDPDTLLSPNGIIKSEQEKHEAAASNDECCISNGNDKQCEANSSDGTSCKASTDCHTANMENKATDALFGKEKASLISNPATLLDVSVSLERIRAKFKLLCVLLRTKQPFDLKTMLGSRNEPEKGLNEEGNNKEVSVDASLLNSTVDLRDKNIEPKPGGQGDEGFGHTPGKDSSALESDW
ncbi:hypothetical protein ACHAXR_008742 [Thalassiosira sp. AJA248-18]